MPGPEEDDETPPPLPAGRNHVSLVFFSRCECRILIVHLFSEISGPALAISLGGRASSTSGASFFNVCQLIPPRTTRHDFYPALIGIHCETCVVCCPCAACHVARADAQR